MVSRGNVAGSATWGAQPPHRWRRPTRPSGQQSAPSAPGRPAHHSGATSIPPPQRWHSPVASPALSGSLRRIASSCRSLSEPLWLTAMATAPRQRLRQIRSNSASVRGRRAAAASTSSTAESLGIERRFGTTAAPTTTRGGSTPSSCGGREVAPTVGNAHSLCVVVVYSPPHHQAGAMQKKPR